MGDSDDEYQNNSGTLAHSNGNNNGVMSGNNSSYNNKNKNNNRNKFYRERDDSNNSGYGNNRRENWNNSDRNNRGGNDSYKNNYQSGSNRPYSGYGNSNQASGVSGGSTYNRGASDYPKKYSNQSPTSGGHHGDSSPPPYKRNRRDYEDSGRSHGGDYSSPQSGNPRGQQPNESDFPTQPPFLSFKIFLAQQSDDISDEDAIKKYNDYKMDFKKTQINNFFLEHKEEDWFKLRYHPDENHKRRNEHNAFILKRLEVFMDLMNKGWLENVSSEFDKSKEIIKFLDAVVIKLEGGSDQDLQILEESSESDKPTNEDDVQEIKVKKEEEPEKDGSDNDGEIRESNEDTNGKSKKRKSEDSDGSESGAYSESDNEDGVKNGESRKKSRKSKAERSKNFHKTTSIFMRNLAPSVTKQDLENLCKDYDGFKRVAISDPAPERGFFRRGWITFESHVDVKKICWNLSNTKIKDFNPGAIVNRELANRIRPVTGLVSYHKNVIKNDIKTAMQIIENMDKKWRLWCKEGDESFVEAEEEEPEEKVDESKMDSESTETVKLEKMAFSSIKPTEPKYLKHQFLGPNPLFKNITDYIVDEVDAEEQELLGDSVNTQPKSTSSPIDIEIDRSYNAVLDRLVLYLRVVHSFDFYNSIEYQQEDSMPNRCGIMFVRPSLIASTNFKTTLNEVANYIKQFDAKMKPYIDYKERLDLQTAQKLGTKDRKEEVEKFIKTNTQELAADRWLCPLSGKKFKGPEFIRKHLFYKHMDKIVDVKKEVEYFNNYVYDPKRPQLPEHQSNKAAGGAAHQHGGQNMGPNAQAGFNNPNYMQSGPGMMQGGMMPHMGGYGGMPGRQMGAYSMQGGYMQDVQQQGYGGNYGSNYNQGYNQMNRGRGGFNMNRGGGRGGRDSREMIQYRDLDAPDE